MSLRLAPSRPIGESFYQSADVMARFLRRATYSSSSRDFMAGLGKEGWDKTRGLGSLLFQIPALTERRRRLVVRRNSGLKSGRAGCGMRDAGFHQGCGRSANGPENPEWAGRQLRPRSQRWKRP